MRAARTRREIRLTEPTWHWYLLVAIGSGMGGAGRLFVSTLVGRVAGYGFPWGTLFVNVLGCFAVGALGALFAPSNPLHLRHDLRMLVIVGILGGFETYDRVPPTVEPDEPILRITGLALMGGFAIETRLPGESRGDARRRKKRERRAGARPALPAPKDRG